MINEPICKLCHQPWGEHGIYFDANTIPPDAQEGDFGDANIRGMYCRTVDRERFRVWRRPLPNCIEIGVCLWKRESSFRPRRVLDVRLGWWRFCCGWTTKARLR